MTDSVRPPRIYRLEWDDGGRIEPYLARARSWARNKDILVIVDAQVSAAALAILEARKLGVEMYYKKELFAEPCLYLHQVKRVDKKGSWVFSDEPAAYGFPSPVNGYRKVTMKELGIKPCSKKYKPDITLPLRINWR